jgi:hypothetical protein
VTPKKSCPKDLPGAIWSEEVPLKRLSLSLLLFSLLWASQAVAKDGPKSPVPRTVLDAPKPVWRALRDPFFPGVLRPTTGPKIRRWNLWWSHNELAAPWIQAHPAESQWIRNHRKLGAWAKTYPKKANLVDEHPEIEEFFRRSPRARAIQKNQPGLAKIFAQGEKDHWGVPQHPPRKQGRKEKNRGTPTPDEIRKHLQQEEGLKGEQLEQAVQRAIARFQREPQREDEEEEREEEETR